jgi:putative Ca2+/H+ antiporter (TMEM165/GDT1 family)
MEAFLVSTGLVAIAEIGDKTMLLAIALAATWRRPVPIIFGILAATIANHALAALVGTLAAHYLSGPVDEVDHRLRLPGLRRLGPDPR